MIAKKQQSAELAPFHVLLRRIASKYTKIFNRQAATSENQWKTGTFQNKEHQMRPRERVFNRLHRTEKFFAETKWRQSVH